MSKGSGDPWGSFKGDIDRGRGRYIDTDIDSDMAVSINWGSLKRSQGSFKEVLGLI